MGPQVGVVVFWVLVFFFFFFLGGGKKKKCGGVEGGFVPCMNFYSPTAANAVIFKLVFSLGGIHTGSAWPGAPTQGCWFNMQ